MGITFGTHHQDIICGVKGCNNPNSYDCMINTKECQLIEAKIKEEKIMKVFVLTWGKQDENGRVFYHDTHVELFKTEEEAQKRALELGEEFIPDAQNTEELVERRKIQSSQKARNKFFEEREKLYGKRKRD